MDENGNVIEDVVDGVGDAGKDVIDGVENVWMISQTMQPAEMQRIPTEPVGMPEMELQIRKW